MSPEISTKARLTLIQPVKNDRAAPPIAGGKGHALPAVEPEEIIRLAYDLARVLGIPAHLLGPARETRRELRARSVIDLAEFRRALV